MGEEKITTYIGEDGLAYCQVCKKPMEKYYPSDLFGMKRKHPVPCACREAHDLEVRKYHEQKERSERIERNKSICFLDKKMREKNFEMVNGSCPSISYAYDYVSNWKEMRSKNIGLCLWGDLGTGKSYMAACIANALLEQEVTVKMTNFATIINDMSPFEGKNEYVEALSRYDLLIIDDLGAESHTDYRLDNIFQVIDRRIQAAKPMIITTNLMLHELKSTEKLAEKRIYDRILENCIPVCVKGVNIRQENRKEKKSFLNKIFKRNSTSGQLSRSHLRRRMRKERISMSNYQIPYWEKYTLSIEEAASYFRIGEGKLRKMVSENPSAEYLLWNGNRVQIKREKFEAFVDTLSAV